MLFKIFALYLLYFSARKFSNLFKITCVIVNLNFNKFQVLQTQVSTNFNYGKIQILTISIIANSNFRCVENYQVGKRHKADFVSMRLQNPCKSSVAIDYLFIADILARINFHTLCEPFFSVVGVSAYVQLCIS